MQVEPTPTQSRAAGQVKVDLGIETKLAWMRWCTDRGLVPGKALRTLVERALLEGLELTASGTGSVIKVVVAKQPDRGPKVGREIQFTPSENAAIEAVAKAQGFGFQEWVIAATRAALAKAPSFGQVELEALVQSNAQMAQIALDLAALRGQEAGEVVQVLERLEKDVRKHVEAVSAAMAQGAQRWQLKV